MCESDQHQRDPLPADILLERHRKEIAELDRQILTLVSMRQALARKVGELKSSTSTPLRNFEVETHVYQRLEQASLELGLDARLGRELAFFLIEKAVEEQASQRDCVYPGGELEALIIGGKGGMGSWIARFLAGQGHRVRISDPAAAASTFEEVSSLDAAVGTADIIVLAVPMDVCPELLERLGAARPPGVIVEMCSLKGHLLPLISRLRDQGLRLVSLHPLFGPDVRMLADRKIVICREGDRSDIDLVRGLFEKTSAELIEIDTHEHDRRMGAVLNLTHLTSLLFARALAHSGIEARQLDEVGGVTFRKQLTTTKEVSSENPQLYYQIQALNSNTSLAASWLRQALDEWVHLIAERDEPGFEALMRACNSYLTGVTTNGGMSSG